MPAQIDPGKDGYSDKLAKLLPAEGMAALLAIKNIIPNVSSADKWLFFSALVIAIFVVLWARVMRKIRAWTQLLFLTFGYFIWAANVLSDRFAQYFQHWLGDSSYSFAPPVVATLYTLFIPLLYRGGRN